MCFVLQRDSKTCPGIYSESGSAEVSWRPTGHVPCPEGQTPVSVWLLNPTLSFSAQIILIMLHLLKLLPVEVSLIKISIRSHRTEQMLTIIHVDECVKETFRILYRKSLTRFSFTSREKHPYRLHSTATLPFFKINTLLYI